MKHYIVKHVLYGYVTNPNTLETSFELNKSHEFSNYEVFKFLAQIASVEQYYIVLDKNQQGVLKWDSLTFYLYQL